MASTTHGPLADPEQDDAVGRRFARTLLRTSLVVVPGYLLVVLLVGTFSGWLFPLGESASSWGVLAAAGGVVAAALLPALLAL